MLAGQNRLWPERNPQFLVWSIIGAQSRPPLGQHSKIGPHVFDTSMPPPPPRTPWNPEGQGSSQNTHTKLSRQYSVNPNYDPRIHNQHAPKQDFSYPPPPFPVGNPSATHLTVTRNASEPDPAYMVNPNTVIQQAQSSNPQPHEGQAELCKTWSTPTAPSANASSSTTGAVSPFFGLPRGGVWETSRPHGDVRSKLYYYLAKLFDEDAVIRAMASLPHETDPKVICNLIISMESSNATSTTAAGTGNAHIWRRKKILRRQKVYLLKQKVKDSVIRF